VPGDDPSRCLATADAELQIAHGPYASGGDADRVLELVIRPDLGPDPAQVRGRIEVELLTPVRHASSLRTPELAAMLNPAPSEEEPTLPTD
jgi:hypothetical protein